MKEDERVNGRPSWRLNNLSVNSVYYAYLKLDEVIKSLSH